MKGVTMRKAMLAVLLALGGLAAPSLAEGLPPICARGAVSGPLPMAHLIQLEMTDYLVMHGGRVDFDAFAPEDLDDTEAVMAAYTLAAAIEWPGVLADRAAELPKAAHDLPWLVLLASVDSTHGDPVWTLTQGAESILSPDLLPVMERHGLTEEARVLRMAMALFPDWGLNPADRAGQVIGFDSQTRDEALSAGLDAASRTWPKGANRARDAALALIAADPALLAAFEARLAALDDVGRLDILMRDLWAACMTDWWSPSEADRALAAMGTAQAALLLMDSFSYTIEPPSIHAWFDEPSATLSPMLLRLLERRGLTDLAQALRDGMALFPQPFPRDTEARWEVLRTMDDAAIGRLDALLPEDAYDRARDDMLRLARESGLLPG